MITAGCKMLGGSCVYKQALGPAYYFAINCKRAIKLKAGLGLLGVLFSELEFELRIVRNMSDGFGCTDALRLPQYPLRQHVNCLTPTSTRQRSCRILWSPQFAGLSAEITSAAIGSFLIAHRVHSSTFDFTYGPLDLIENSKHYRGESLNSRPIHCSQ